MAKRKKQKKHKASLPLSKIDKLTYGFLMLVCLLMPAAIYYFYGSLQQWYIFSQPNVSAYSETAASLWILLPVIFVFLLPFCIVECRRTDRIPIWKKQVQPKKKKIPIKAKVIISVFLAGLFILLSLPSVFSFFIRYQVVGTTIQKYNGLNQISREYDFADASEYLVEAYQSRNGRTVTYTYKVRFKIYFPQKAISIDIFESVDAMGQIDQGLSDAVKTVKGKEELAALKENWNLTDAEWNIIESIFMD